MIIPGYVFLSKRIILIRYKTVFLLLLCTPPSAGVAQESADRSDELQSLVTAYFKTTFEGERTHLAERIEALDGVTVDSVADAVKSVKLWNPQPSGLQDFGLETKRGVTMPVHVHVPSGYDPDKAYPLLIALHGSGGSGGRYIHFALRLLGDRVNEFIVAAPTKLEGCFIGSTELEAFDPPALFRELKQRYHIDTDRVYANGYSKGGHISFLMGLLYTDTLAASVPLAATFATQIGTELMDVMLPNVRHLPTMIVYGELDRQDRQHRRGIDEKSGISGANRYMARRAGRLDIPIRFIELKGVGHGGVTPPPDEFHEMLRKVRPHDLTEFEHWFRYPPQGRLNWLRQTRYQGPPWKGQHLRVTPKPDENYSKAMIKKIKLRLAYVGGLIEGQSIHIQTRKCSQLDLLLNDDLVDLDQDIIVTLKGKEIYRGPAYARIRTLLEVARQDWDFQRLFPARFKITRKGEIEPY